MSTLGAYFRLARVGWVLVREGVVLALPSDDLPAPAQALKALLKPFARSKAKRAQRSDRLATAVERLGPSYVKMGQFLATRPDVVGADFADDLASLQDRMAFFPAAAAKANIEGSLGRTVSDLYRNSAIRSRLPPSPRFIRQWWIRRRDHARWPSRSFVPACASVSRTIWRRCI